MAAGFKTATVTSAKVPSTQTNYPSYVDLSRLGITTLAEAQSVRVYADSSKTTEWAREIVSATEMHVKVPSLTSTTPIYVDWDGVRSDYAVTDTYGRNAVWSDYELVHHNVNSTDSAGKHDVTANGGVSIGGVSGQLGAGTDFDGTNDGATHTATALGAKSAVSIQMWLNPDTVAARCGLVMNDDGVGFSTSAFGVQMSDGNAGRLQLRISTTAAAGGFSSLDSSNGLITAGSWQKVTASRNGVNGAIYKNGAVDTTTSALPSGSTNNIAKFGFGAFGIGAFLYYNGKMDEVRIANFGITANWETTEYNNQSDEAGFWGTWTDVGGGGPTPTYSNFLMMGVG